MTVSLRLSKEDSDLFREYAKLHNMSMSDLIRSAVLEKIENEYDLKMFEKAMADYRRNPVTYTLDQVEQELGL